MNNKIRLVAGDHIAWKWASGIAQGVIVDVVPHRAEIVSNGKKIVRNGTEQNPAVLIKHSSGVSVLKLSSEVTKTSE